MYTIKRILTAASFAVLAAAGASAANAASFDNHGDNHWDHRAPVVRHDPYFTHAHRPIVVRERVFETLRFHHYRGVADPVFVHGHYVVRSFDRFGHVVFVEVDPYTGAFLGEIRI